MNGDTERLSEEPFSLEGRQNESRQQVVFLNERRRSALAEIDDAPFSHVLHLWLPFLVRLTCPP